MVFMLTPQELSERLKAVNVEALAKEADVSVKTIYRLRHMTHSPRLDLVVKLVAAMDRLKAAA